MKRKSICLIASAAVICGSTFPLWSEMSTVKASDSNGSSEKTGVENVLQYSRPVGFKSEGPKRDAPGAPLFESASLTQPLYGSVVTYNPEATFDGVGIYRIPMESLPNQMVFPGIMAEMGGLVIGDTYYGISRKQITSTAMVGTISSYSMLTGERLSSFDATPAVMSFDIAYDPTTEKVYGCFFSEDLTRYEFGTLDLATGERPTICGLSEPWNSCAFDAEGQLWVLGKNGNFYKVDKETGVMEFIGVSGVSPRYYTSAVIDQNSGRFFSTISPSSGKSMLVEIDKSNGKATVLREFEADEEITGLAFWGEAKNNQAPAKVTDLDVNFARGSLAGTVTLTAPVKDIAGEELDASEELTVHIVVDGQSILTRKLAPGATGNYTIALTSSGRKIFDVYCSNEFGDGVDEYRSVFVGNGTPSAPVNAAWTLDGTHAVISWNSVTTSADGGYVNPSDITYSVVRMPDGHVVATDTKKTIVEETITLPDEISDVYYEITAKYLDCTSEAAKTPAKVLGHYAVAPYDIEFTDDYKMTGWRIIDNNNDGKTWRYFNGMVFCDSGNGRIDEDDWFISVPVKMEKGKYYTMEAELQSTNVMTQMHEFEVLSGRGQEMSDLTSTVIPPTIIHEATWRWYSGEICPDDNGNYNVGFHVISKGSTNRIVLRSMKIDEGRSVKVPAKVDNFVLTPDAGYDRKAKLSFNVPSKCYDGSALSKITKLEILRNDTVIRTETSVTPGSAMTHDDNDVKINGINKYTVIVYNNEGASSKAELEDYIGVRAPKEVQNVVLVPIEEKPGYVRVTWDAPQFDVENNEIPASKIRYRITDTDASRTLIAENITETSFEYKACDVDTQHLVGVIVQSVTDGGYNSGVSSNVLFLGAPLASPVFESFADGKTSYEMMYDPEGTYGRVSLQNDGTVRGITSYDEDNGFASITGQTMNDVANIIMGYVQLEEVNPFLSVAIYGEAQVSVGRGMGPNNNEFSVEILENDEWKQLYHTVVKELPDGEWTNVVVPLTDYAGEIVQLRLRGKKMTYGTNYTYFDRLVISSSQDHNLALSTFAVPDKVLPDKEFELNATVSNTGLKAAESSTLEIYRDDELIHTEEIGNLEPGQNYKVKKTAVISRFDEPAHTFKAVIKYEQDQKESDNVLTVETVLMNTGLPCPTNFAGSTREQGGASLSWEAPVIDPQPEKVVEDMENSVAFEDYLDGWTFVDKDGIAVGGLADYDIPGLVPGTSKKSFFVVDSDMMPDFEPFKAFSGKRYLATMFCIYGEQNDDWVISPCLSGNAQKVSFMAKSTTDSNIESIEVLYSDGSLDTEEFQVVRSIEALPASWVLIQTELPEGAQYFAIRCRSINGGMLMIDDITYESGGVGAGLVHEGYKLYRDDVEALTLDADASSHIDNATTVGTHVYRLTAVYDKGESALSAPVEVLISDIDGIARNLASSATVTVFPGRVQISNPEGDLVNIVDVEGRVVYSASECGTFNVALHSGIYIVKAGNLERKVNIR